MTTDPNSYAGGIFSSFTAPWSSSWQPPSSTPNRAPRVAPRSTVHSNGARRQPQQRAQAAAPPRAHTVTLQGIADGKTLGAYSLSYAAGQLMVSSSRDGGAYGVDFLPFGEWFVLADERGVALPVAVQRIRVDAYCVRVDRAPLRGLRALTSYPGFVPSGSSANPQQQRHNDQMAIQALQTSANARMYTARHLNG